MPASWALELCVATQYNTGHLQAFDVVTVPDFAGPASARFEARTLLFLASWIEHAGVARSFPLHLACIGDPPASVQWLARRCGARISVHAPIQSVGRSYANKLRGLEIKGLEERVLLLDVDVLILSDLSPLASMAPGIAVAPAFKARVPERYWRRIYPALSMEVPSERIATIRGRVACTAHRIQLYPEQHAEMSAMLPYYNSGVILAPWACGLRSVWEDHLRRIAAIFQSTDEAWASVGASDQAGLATALQWLKRQGVPIHMLPDACHASWLLVYRNTLPPDEFVLFHALRIFGNTARPSEDLSLHLYRYRIHLMNQMRGEWWRDRTRTSRWQLAWEYLLPSLARANRLAVRLHDLHRKHVQDAIRHTRGSDASRPV